MSAAANSTRKAGSNGQKANKYLLTRFLSRYLILHIMKLFFSVVYSYLIFFSSYQLFFTTCSIFQERLSQVVQLLKDFVASVDTITISNYNSTLVMKTTDLQKKLHSTKTIGVVLRLALHYQLDRHNFPVRLLHAPLICSYHAGKKRWNAAFTQLGNQVDRFHSILNDRLLEATDQPK
jgi:hypothetical protein